MGTNFKGLGALRTAASLLKKPEHDLARMDTQPGEEYVAFDFFVTAEHLPDWVTAGEEPTANGIRSNVPLLKIVSHIASGAKHFHTRCTTRKSISNLEDTGYAIDYADDHLEE